MIATAQDTDLCRIAARHDTDKGPGFTRTYHSLLSHVRDEPLRLLEIGLYNGGSMRMFREYLPNATLHGIDIDPRCFAYQDEIPGTQVRLLDQGDPAALNAFIDELGGEYDLILDDGGHTMQQQITSFETLWPHVTPGGAYIIEDIGTSYFLEYGGRELNEPGTSMDLCKRLTDAVNLGGDVAQGFVSTPGTVRPAVSQAALIGLRTDVASVHFHPHTVVIVKASV
jgi:hypothetical protein